VGWVGIVKAQSSLDHGTPCVLAVLPPRHEAGGEEDHEADGEDGGAGDEECAHAVGVGEVDDHVEGGEERAEEHQDGGDQEPGFDGFAGALDGDDLVVGEADDHGVGGCAVVGG